MVLLNSRRKVLVVLVSLVLSSLLCLIVVYRRRRTEKLTDYHFMKDDNRLAGHQSHTLTADSAGSSGTRSTWTLPTRSPDWRRSLPASMSLPGELSTSVRSSSLSRSSPVEAFQT